MLHKLGFLKELKFNNGITLFFAVSFGLKTIRCQISLSI
jgi:hypothetical protein